MAIPPPPPGFTLDQDSGVPPPPPGFTIDKPQMGGKPPIGFVADMVSKMAPWNKASQGLRNIAGMGAEKLGGMGVPPKVAAGAMLPVSMFPELLGAGTTISGMMTSPEPFAQAIRKTPQMVGKEMGQLEDAAGVGKDLPIRRGAMPRFPQGSPELSPKPESYPKDPSTFINFVNKRMKDWGSIEPSELSDYNKIFSEMFRKGDVAEGTPQFAEATKTSQAVNSLFNKKVPGRGELSQVYGLAKKIRPDPTDMIKAVLKKLLPKMIIYR